MFKLFSNTAKLRKAIVHTPGIEIERLIPWYIEHPLTFDVEYTRHLPTLQKEHLSLVRVLQDEIGAKNVYQVSELLRELFESEGEKRREILLDILGESVLSIYVTSLHDIDGQRIENRSSVDLAQDMIVGYPREWRMTSAGGVMPPCILPKDGLRHVRDPLAILPTGIVLGAFQRLRRKGDPALIRAIFKYHPTLRSDIMFDFDDELQRLELTQGFASPLCASLEGGNVQVFSDDSIAIGISYAWSNANYDAQRYSFEKVVEELFERDPSHQLQRIYIVYIPNFQHFWHLDSVFNMIGPKSAIAMPYIFGYPSPLKDSIFPIVNRIAHDLVLSGDYPVYPYNLPSKLDLEYSGMAEVYLREDFDRKNRAIPSDIKTRNFFDQLEKDGLLDVNQVVWAGGNPSEFTCPFEHVRVALREQASQACNVFVVRPFCVIAVAQNPYTLQMLQDFVEQHNGHVEIVPGVEQVKSEGGPHCLIADLERDR